MARRLDANPYVAKVSAASGHAKGVESAPGRGGGRDLPGQSKPEPARLAPNRPGVAAGGPLPENFGGSKGE